MKIACWGTCRQLDSRYAIWVGKKASEAVFATSGKRKKALNFFGLLVSHCMSVSAKLKGQVLLTCVRVLPTFKLQQRFLLHNIPKFNVSHFILYSLIVHSSRLLAKVLKRVLLKEGEFKLERDLDALFFLYFPQTNPRKYNYWKVYLAFSGPCCGIIPGSQLNWHKASI